MTVSILVNYVQVRPAPAIPAAKFEFASAFIGSLNSLVAILDHLQERAEIGTYTALCPDTLCSRNRVGPRLNGC